MKTFILSLLLCAPVYGQINSVDKLTDTAGTRQMMRQNFNYLNDEKLDIITASSTYVTKEGAAGTYLTISTAVVTYAPLAGNRTFAGFTALGIGNAQIKVKILTGTSGRMNSVVAIAHGLTGDKIVGFSAKIHQNTNWGVLPGYEYSAGYNYECYQDDTNFGVQLSSTNSASIQEKPITIMVVYIE